MNKNMKPEILPYSDRGCDNQYDAVDENGDIVIVEKYKDNNTLDEYVEFNEFDKNLDKNNGEKKTENSKSINKPNLYKRNSALFRMIVFLGQANRDSGISNYSNKEKIKGYYYAESRETGRRKEAQILGKEACRNCPFIDNCDLNTIMPKMIDKMSEIGKNGQLARNTAKRAFQGKTHGKGGNIVREFNSNKTCEEVYNKIIDNENKRNKKQ